MIHLSRHLADGRASLGVAQPDGAGAEAARHGSEATGKRPDLIVAGGDGVDVRVWKSIESAALASVAIGDSTRRRARR